MWYQCVYTFCLIAERFLKLEKEIDDIKVTANGLSLPGRFALHSCALYCAVHCWEIVVQYC